jgi:hypothetical protein
LAIKDIEQRLLKQYPGILGTTIAEIPAAFKTVMQWYTAEDDKVCQAICMPLDGKQWEIDDASIPTPPDFSHPNCRCRLGLTEIPLEQELDVSTSAEASLISMVELVMSI